MNQGMVSSINRGRSFLALALICAWSIRSIFSASPIENWTSIHSSPGTGFVGVAAGAGRIVAVDGSGTIISWEKENPGVKSTFNASGPLRGITFGSGQFVVVGWEGLILSSADGLNWIESTSREPANFHDVVFGNGVFLAVSSGTLLRSTNGLYWTAPARPTPWHFAKVYFAGGTFLLSMDPGTNYLSTDGLDWTAAPSGTTNNLYSIGYGNGQFIAFAIGNEILTSVDARSWQKRGILPDVLRPLPVVEGNGYLVTAGGNGRAYSRDGITWHTLVTDTHHGGRLIFVDGRFLAAGYEHILQSGPIVTLNLESPGTLTLSGAPNTQYRIESTDSFLPNATWSLQQILTTSPSSAPTKWTDPRPVSTTRFYRASR